MGLPKSTEFNKRVPKQKFYENIKISADLKRYFVEQIKVIYWKNKIASSTVNVKEGNMVTEIEVFEIKLAQRQLEEKVLRQIDKEIPYHIIFLLEHEGKYQVWTAYKEVLDLEKNTVKIGQYYHTDWIEEEKMSLTLDGLNIDEVYENLVRQIAGERLETNRQESIKETIERDNYKNELQRKINELQKKVRKEKQFNKQVFLSMELKKLKKELEEI